MSAHSFGVIQTNCGRPLRRSPGSSVNGTTLLHRRGRFRMSLKYMNGSCFFAYAFGSVPEDAPA